MQFAFFYPKDIQKIFQKTSDFVENLEMTQIARVGGRVLYVILMQLWFTPFIIKWQVYKS